MAWYGTAVSADSVSPLRIEVRGQLMLLIRADREWYAIEDRCSHAGCAFSDDGEFDGAVAICNCHGSEFDVRTGAALVGPAARPVRTFAVRRIDDRLEVEL